MTARLRGNGFFNMLGLGGGFGAAARALPEGTA